MSHNALHHVSDLSADARSTIEAIVGHPLYNGDTLYIATLTTEPQSPASERDAAWNELEHIISQMQAHAARSGLTSSEIDEVIGSECAAVRYGSAADRE